MLQDWPERSISEIATVNPRRDPAIRSMGDQILATFVPMAAIDEISGTIANLEIKTLGEMRKGFTPFHENDVLFAKITPCMQNGKSAVAHGLSNGLGFGSTEFHVIRSGPKVLPKWIWYFVRQRSVRERAQQHFRGSAGQQRVPADFLKRLKIPVPSIAKQRLVLSRIADCMDRIDEIRALRAQSSLAETALLPSSLASTFVSLKTEYPGVAIGECLVESRYGTSRRCDAPSTATPVLRIPNVSQGHLSFDDLKYCELDDKELKRLRIRNGDILVVRTNGSPHIVGRCSVYVEGDRPFAFASYLIRLRIDRDKADPNFLAFFLTSTMGRDAIAGIRRTSAGQYNVNSENLRGIMVPLPPLSIQKETTERLMEERAVVRAIVECQSVRAAEIEQLTSSILRKAFAGDL